ncbi:DUF6694 family lipoprotein [Vreelandella venusta]|uniref:DUF6694 family lipoprotein n=1 Tax=Vreelandella venusta TaxID=44935 RepID=UPI00384B388C
MKRVLAVAIAVAMAGVAYADPTIDGSNPRYFDRSLEEIRASLDKSEVERFDDALEALLMRRSQEGLTVIEMSELSDDELEDLATEARRSLHGLSGQEVLALAGEQSEKMKDSNALEEPIAQEMLSRFVVENAQYRLSEEGASGATPVIELRVTNNTGEPVARVHFRGVLQSPGRSVPWVNETFYYTISGGIEPGETLEWSLAPDRSGPWGNPSISDDAMLSMEVLRLDDPAGNTLWERP